MKRASRVGTTYIYCDGGCRGNSAKENIGGYGIVVYLNTGQVLECRGHELNTTNNIMELKACIEALKLIQDKKSPIVVTSDSLYLVRGMNEWSLNWINNDWVTKKGDPVANKELWLQLIALRHMFDSVEFIHCKGHADNAGNNRADALANMAMDDYLNPF